MTSSLLPDFVPNKKQISPWMLCNTKHVLRSPYCVTDNCYVFVRDYNEVFNITYVSLFHYIDKINYISYVLASGQRCIFTFYFQTGDHRGAFYLSIYLLVCSYNFFSTA